MKDLNFDDHIRAAKAGRAQHGYPDPKPYKPTEAVTLEQLPEPTEERPGPVERAANWFNKFYWFFRISKYVAIAMFVLRC